jgi:hypothetical protein
MGLGTFKIRSHDHEFCRSDISNEIVHSYDSKPRLAIHSTNLRVKLRLNCLN